MNLEYTLPCIKGRPGAKRVINWQEIAGVRGDEVDTSMEIAWWSRRGVDRRNGMAKARLFASNNIVLQF